MNNSIIASGNLFVVAAQVYGDAMLWTILATANDLRDLWLPGISVIQIPQRARFDFPTVG